MGDLRVDFANEGGFQTWHRWLPPYCQTDCVIFCWKAYRWLPSWSHPLLQCLPSRVPLHRCHEKVTGVTQKLVSAVTQTHTHIYI